MNEPMQRNIAATRPNSAYAAHTPNFSRTAKQRNPTIKHMPINVASHGIAYLVLDVN
jgi:hypothetical protein